MYDLETHWGSPKAHPNMGMAFVLVIVLSRMVSLSHVSLSVSISCDDLFKPQN